MLLLLVIVSKCGQHLLNFSYSSFALVGTREADGEEEEREIILLFLSSYNSNGVVRKRLYQTKNQTE